MVRQAVPLQPMEVHGGVEIHWQPMEDTMPEQVVTLWEAHARAGSWRDLWNHGEKISHWTRFASRTCDPAGGPMLEQSVPERLQPMEGTHAGEVHEELHPVGKTHVGEVHGELSPVAGTSHWSSRRVWSPPLEEEVTADKKV